MKHKKMIEEMFAWTSGNENILHNFYKNKEGNKSNEIEKSLFWSKGNKQKNIAVHYGRPQLLIEEIQKLVLPNIRYEAEKTLDIANELIKDEYWIKFINEIVKDLASAEVAYGRVLFIEKDELKDKFGYHTDMRFIERINPLNVTEYKIRNRIVGFDINERINCAKILSESEMAIIDNEGEVNLTEQLILRERNVKGWIINSLFNLDGEKVNPADYVLKMPKDTKFKNKDFITMFSVEITKGVIRPSIRHFDYQDEIFSQQRNETRKNKQKIYIPEDAIIKTNTGSHKGYDDMAYEYETIKVPRPHSDDAIVERGKIQSIKADIDPEKRYLIQLRHEDNVIFTNAGLDIASFLPSINGESGKSKDAQYKRTLQTYKIYTNVLGNFFTNIINAYFGLTDALNKETSTTIVSKVYFEEYVKPTLQDRIETYGSPEALNIFSLEKRIRDVMVNADEVTILIEIARKKAEEGFEIENEEVPE